MEFITYNEGNNGHEKKQLSYKNLTNNHQFRFSYYFHLEADLLDFFDFLKPYFK